jgi:hypothetical protein
MNDSELDIKLAAAREPKLDPDYREDFPRLVLARLRSQPSRPALPPERHWLPRLAWSAGLALIFLLAGFAIGHWRGRTEMAAAPAGDILANAKMINETLALFPNRVRAIVRDEKGMRLILADQPNVPDSPPLFVKICDGKNCSSLVTFSGQELDIAGQKITVLADASGGVILEGNRFVWSSTTRDINPRGLEIEARTLGASKL